MLNVNNQQNLIQKLNMFKSLMSGKNPQDVYNYMLSNNPQFRQFIEENKGKSLEDIALAYDIDLDLIKKFM